MFLLNTTISNRTIIILTFLFLAGSVMAQESQESSLSDEMEDSLSSLSIIPLKPLKKKKILRQAIRRFRHDMQHEHDTRMFQMTMTVSRDSLEPFRVKCSIFAKSGIALNEDDVASCSKTFDYEGPYKLTPQDSAVIKGYIKHFAIISPVYVPRIFSIHSPRSSSFGYRIGDVLYPLKNYNQTCFYYETKAYHILDESDRKIYRMHFVRNGQKRYFRFGGKNYEAGEITGTAYIDGRTMYISQFNGTARLPNDKDEVYIVYKITYDEIDNKTFLKHIIAEWRFCGTKINVVLKGSDTNKS